MGEARLVIRAVDESSKALASIEGHVKGLGNALKTIGPASAEIGKVSTALGNVGKVGKELDAVAKSIEHAAQATPALARQSEALGRAATASAAKVRELESEAQRLAQASGKVDLFKSMQGGFGKARSVFAEAKAAVVDYAREIEAADRKLVKLKADAATAKAASGTAWKAVEAAPMPTRADAADAARFAEMKAARDAAIAAHAATVHEQERIKAEIFATQNKRTGHEDEYEKAQAGVSRAAAALDREKAAVIAVKREIEELSGGAMTSLSGVEGRLKTQADGVATALDRQAAAAHHAAEAGRALLAAEDHAKAGRAHDAAAERVAHRIEHGEDHHGFKNYALTTAAMAVSAHAIMEGIEGTLEHGAEYQHKLVALRNAGRTPEEIEEMNAASHAALRGSPTATLTGNLEILNETVGAFGSVEHAIEHLGFMNKAAATLHAVAGDKIGGSAGEMGNQMARFFEMRGTAGNGEVFESEASQMMKSMLFTGGNVNPRELLNFAQQAKSSLQNYDIRFLSRIAPSLIGEVGGDRAGTQANAFNSVILGKANDKKQAEAWIKYGLIDKSQMTKKGDAFTGWNGGAIYHTDEFLKDPFQAIEDHLLPALEKKGINIHDPLALTKVLGTLFRNINAAAFANELAQDQNRKRLHKDEGLIGQVEDPDTIYKRLLKTDPTVAMSAFKGAFGSFLTALSSPVMGTAAASLSGMAENLNELAIAAHEHPVAAVTAGLATAAGSLYAAGKLSYGLVNGFGNAALGPAAGEMLAAGHEQVAAGRMMLTAAEALRVGALERDLPGGVPVGKGGARTAERAVVREGEAMAEGAVEAAIGQKVVGAIEGGLKGGLAVEALEIAATAGVTLTAGSVALLGLSAAAIIGALKASMDPKHEAAKDPGFGRPFAPQAPLDLTDPKFRDPAGMTEEEKKEAAKPWWNRGKGTPRGTVLSQRDTDLPGHWVNGPHGTRHWALEDRSGPKHPAFFSTAPLGMDGLPTVPMPNGLPADPYDKRTWAHIGADLPAPHPELYAPSDVPLPPVRPRDLPAPRVPAPPSTATPLPPIRSRDPVGPDPAPGYPAVERRTFGAYVDKMAPIAKAGGMPMPNRFGGGGPVPVSIVNAPPAMHDGWLDGERPAIEERARRGAAAFNRDHEGTVGQRMMEHLAPLPDLSNIHATVDGPVTATVTGSADVTVKVVVEAGSALISAAATASQARAAVPLSSGGGSTGGTGVQRTAATPGTGST